MEKRCSKCGQTKPIEAFRKCRGRVGQPCLECHRENNRKWREANPDLNAAIQKKYAAEHVEYNRARGRKRYADNREQLSEQIKRYYLSHLKERKAYHQRYRLEHKTEAKEYNRKKRQTNPLPLREKARRWALAHPERKRELDHEANARRRAWKLGAAVNDFTKEQWRWLKKQYSNRCAYCGNDDERLQQDHVIPLAKGGNHTLSNIVPACGACNRKKKDRTLEIAGMGFAIRVPV